MKNQTQQYYLYINGVTGIDQFLKGQDHICVRLSILSEKNQIQDQVWSKPIQKASNQKTIYFGFQTAINMLKSSKLIVDICQCDKNLITHESLCSRQILPVSQFKTDYLSTILPVEAILEGLGSLSTMALTENKLSEQFHNKKEVSCTASIDFCLCTFNIKLNTDSFFQRKSETIKQKEIDVQFTNSDSKHQFYTEILNYMQYKPSDIHLKCVKLEVSAFDMFEYINKLQEDAKLKARIMGCSTDVSYGKLQVTINKKKMLFAQSDYLIQQLIEGKFMPIIKFDVNDIQFNAPKNSLLDVVISIPFRQGSGVFTELILTSCQMRYQQLNRGVLEIGGFQLKFVAEVHENKSDVEDLTTQVTSPIVDKSIKKFVEYNYKTSLQSILVQNQQMRSIQVDFYDFEILAPNYFGDQLKIKLTSLSGQESESIESAKLQSSVPFKPFSLNTSLFSEIGGIQIQISDFVDQIQYPVAQTFIDFKLEKYKHLKSMNDFVDLEFGTLSVFNEFDQLGKLVAKMRCLIRISEAPQTFDVVERPILSEKITKDQIKSQQTAFYSQFDRKKLCFMQQCHARYVYLKNDVETPINLLDGFQIDQQCPHTLVLLEPIPLKLQCYGIEIVSKHDNYRIPSTDIVLRYSPQSAAQTTDPVLKLRFAVLTDQFDLGRVELFVKREIVPDLGGFLLGTMHPHSFCYDSVRKVLRQTSPDANGLVKPLSALLRPINVSAQLGFEGIAHRVQLSAFEALPSFVYFELPAIGSDRAVLASSLFRAEFCALRTQSCEVRSQSGRAAAVPTFGADNFIMNVAGESGFIMFRAGLYTSLVRTSAQHFALEVAAADSEDVRRLLVKLDSKRTVDLEFVTRPSIIIEDPALMRLGKYKRLQSGAVQQIEFAEAVPGYQAVARMLVLGAGGCEQWEIVALWPQ